MSQGEPRVAATCRTCGERLTVSEFKACEGIGHYCAKHRPAGAATKTSSVPKKRTPRSSGGSGAGRRIRRVSESGVIEYPCKAQMAGKGDMRRGRLTPDHPACEEGGVVFVIGDIAYGPDQVVTLFIRDPDGRRLALRAGFECHD